MQRPQSLGGISAGMEFLKVNIFKGKEGEREEKYYKKKQQYLFFSFFF